MKKKLALMLATLTTVAGLFTGCGEKDIHGKYESKIGFGDMLRDEERKEMDEFAEYGIDFTSVEVKINLDLTEEGEFTLSYDGKAFKDDLSNTLQNSMDGLIDASLAEAGLTRDQVTDELAQMNGYDSADALFDDFANQMVPYIEGALEGLEEEVAEDTVTGTYKVSKDSVVFVVEDGDDLELNKATLNDDGSITITIEGDDDKTVDAVFKLQK